MDSIAFPHANFRDPSVSGSALPFPALSALSEEGADQEIDFATLINSLVSDSSIEPAENIPVINVTPIDELPSPPPNGDQPDLEPSALPFFVPIIPWTLPTSKMALDISFISTNEESPSVGEGSALELPQEEGQSPVTNRVPPGELSFTGRIAPGFETLRQSISDVNLSPAGPEAGAFRTTPSAAPQAPMPEAAAVVAEIEQTEKLDLTSDPAVPAPDAQQPISIASPVASATPAGSQPIPANAISAPTSVPPPLQTESKDRTFQVRLGIEDTDVHLRIAERNGELHLAVRANSAEAAGRLREGLPDLMNALQSAGHNSEFWKAGPSSSTSSPSPEAGERSFHDDSPSRKQQQPDQEGGRRRKNRNKDYDPYGVASLA